MTDKDTIFAYLQKKKKDIKEMTEEIGKGDYPSIRMTGASLKKSAQGLGLEKISNFGKDIEHAAGLKDSGKLKDLVSELAKYMETLEAQYK